MKITLICILVASMTNALAQENTTSQRLIFSGNYSTSGNASYRDYTYGKSIKDHDTSIYFELGYAKRLTDMIDLALSPYVSYNKYGGEYKTYQFGLALGPVINFGQNYTDAIFLAPSVSLNSIKISGTGAGSNSNDSYLSYSLELGKRFSLAKLIGTDALTYSPSLGVKYTDRTGDDANYKVTSYNFNFLQLELHF